MRRALWCVGALVGLAGASHAQVIFTDDFESGPSPMWGNERGDWAAAGGEYFAQAPNNNPPTYSSLPFDLADMEIELDVRQVSDGGIWVHTDAAGENGVLLVTGGYGHSGRGFYWHTLENGNYTGPYGQSPDLFKQGDDIHVRITVTGSIYALYFNGDPTPATTLDTNLFPSGRPGLYDFTDVAQRFDNVVVKDLGCYPDCDHNGALNINDFICFQTKFALGDPYADCDANGARNINDFICFQTKFALGCS